MYQWNNAPSSNIQAIFFKQVNFFFLASASYSIIYRNMEIAFYTKRMNEKIK